MWHPNLSSRSRELNRQLHKLASLTSRPSLPLDSVLTHDPPNVMEIILYLFLLKDRITNCLYSCNNGVINCLYWSRITSSIFSLWDPQRLLQWSFAYFRWWCWLTLHSPPAQSCISLGSSCHWSWYSQRSGPVVCPRSSSARKGSPEGGDTTEKWLRAPINERFINI